MSQPTISSNGQRTTASPGAEDLDGPMTITAPERRQTAAPETVSPEALVERHVEGARRQLAEARERLKAARRRVVQLEDALCNWERFAAELRRDGRRNPA